MLVITMTKTEVLEKAGGGRGAVSRVAKILGISRQAVSDWPEMVPDLRIYQLRERKPEWFVSDVALSMGKDKPMSLAQEAA
jgi:hypothetical protein